MPRVFNIISKYKAPALLIALALCFFTFWSLKDHQKNPSSQPPTIQQPHLHEDHSDHGVSDTKQKEKEEDDHDHSDHNHQKVSKITEDQKKKLKSLESFSFKREQKLVEEKLKKFDQYKEELVTIILMPDPYLGLPTQPHTIHSVLKNQRGAFKVWTLRKIASVEKNQTVLFERIANEAKDNTIRNIAKAALNLIKQGSKNPLKDITNSIENLGAISDD